MPSSDASMVRYMDRVADVAFLPLALVRGRALWIRVCALIVLPVWFMAVGLPLLLICGIPLMIASTVLDMWEAMR